MDRWHPRSLSPDLYTSLERLLPLLSDPSQDTEHWEGWRVTRIHGGTNNRLYRATNAEYDLAIKWTIRDQRHRARREYAALRALAYQGLEIAPVPILLNEEFLHPVVVYHWIVGNVSVAPPASDDEWTHLVDHLATIHSINPAAASVRLEHAVLNANSAVACRQLLRQQLDQLPTVARPQVLQQLLANLEPWLERTWDDVPPALCRVDPNTTNFVRRAEGWASIDWENSGWGDPAFEIADLMSHPAYVHVDPARWSWVIDRYCNLTTGQDTSHRIAIYYRMMLVWWVMRFARTLYEVPRGADVRLVERPAHWKQDIEQKLLNAIERAKAVLDVPA